MPLEGYRVAFFGTLGRLEVRDFERQSWQQVDHTEIHVIKNFGQREKISPTGSTEGGHGGGDTRLWSRRPSVPIAGHATAAATRKLLAPDYPQSSGSGGDMIPD